MSARSRRPHPCRRLPAPPSRAPGDGGRTAYLSPRDGSGHRRSALGGVLFGSTGNEPGNVIPAKSGNLGTVGLKRLPPVQARAKPTTPAFAGLTVTDWKH